LKNSLVVIFGLLFAWTGLAVVAIAQKAAAKDDDKVQVAEAGYITKVDFKKKMLIVRGYVSPLPGENSGQKGEVPSGGGRGGGRRGGDAGRGEANPEESRMFRIFFSTDTVVQTGTTKLTPMDLSVNQFVMIIGNRKGKTEDVDATSILITER
jgi:hypothetical protein